MGTSLAAPFVSPRKNRNKDKKEKRKQEVRESNRIPMFLNPPLNRSSNCLKLITIQAFGSALPPLFPSMGLLEEHEACTSPARIIIKINY